MARVKAAAPLGGRASAGRAVLSGALLGAAFLDPALGWLSWFALVPLLDVLDARLRARAPARTLFRAGYGFGVAWFALGIHWIARLSDVAITVPWLRYPAWIAAALYLAVFPALAAMVAGWLSRRSGFSIAVTFPLAFLAAEELRASGELGFPWFQPGYAQAAFPPLLQMAALGGVTLVTAWVLLLNVLLWRSLTARSRMRSAFGALLCFLLPWLWGQRVLDAAPAAAGPQVALVQGNIPGAMKWSGEHQDEILARFLRLTAEGARRQPRPALAIWPETATGSYLRQQLDQALQVANLAARTGVPVFTGYADYERLPDGGVQSFNAAGIFGVRGETSERYAKRHLVPFGERMPFQGVLPFLGRIGLGQAEWTPGAAPVLFPADSAGAFSTLICFESIFPDLARGDVRRGARWLVNITNDEWFGRSAALPQHAAMAQFRAVENRVPLARCANTGITMLVDAWGRVRAKLPEFEEGVLVGPLEGLGVAARTPTWFSRFGDWPGVAAGLLVLLLAFSPVRLGERWER